MTWKSKIKAGVEHLLALSKADAWYARRQAESSATILRYHSVAGPDAVPLIAPGNRISPNLFEAHMRALSVHRRPVSLSRIAHCLENGEAFEPGTVCVTFDDGYLDNFTEAAPILAAHDIPATLYLPTRYVDEAKTQWADRLHVLVQRAPRGRVAWGDQHVILRRSLSRRDAFRRMSRDLIPMRDHERDMRLARLAEETGQGHLQARLTLNWSEVRTLITQYPGFALGTHSASHADLTSLDVDEADMEIKDCTQRFQSVLGTAPDHFSFPYGRSTSALRRRVLEYGYKTIVASSPELVVTQSTRTTWVPRIDASIGVRRLRFRTSGAYPGLSLRLMRRA